VEAEELEVDSLSTSGQTKLHLPILIYDFLAHGILSDYDGLLGLDFFENTAFCIDMVTDTIEIIHPQEK
jgi:hypothetical protein